MEEITFPITICAGSKHTAKKLAALIYEAAEREFENVTADRGVPIRMLIGKAKWAKVLPSPPSAKGAKYD